GHRDQGAGRPPHDPDHAARRGPRRARQAARRARRRAPRRCRGARVQRFRPRDPRAARVVRCAGHRDRRRWPRRRIPPAHRRRKRPPGGRMTAFTLTRFELLRTLRSKRFFVLSLALPLGLYLLIAGANRAVRNLAGTGLPAPLYFMVGMAAFGAIAASLS